MQLLSGHVTESYARWLSGNFRQRITEEANLLATPGVGHQQVAIGGLDQGRIRILARTRFQIVEILPMLAIIADCQVERRAALRGAIVDHYQAAIPQAYDSQSQSSDSAAQWSVLPTR